jgi:hypothetical protein
VVAAEASADDRASWPLNEAARPCVNILDAAFTQHRAESLCKVCECHCGADLNEAKRRHGGFILGTQGAGMYASACTVHWAASKSQH